MEKYELQKLRDLPIEGVAERLGLRVSRHKTLCPFHDDHSPSLSFSVRRNTYRCFVCGASGDSISLVMRHLNLDFKEACRWLQTLPLAPPCMEGSRYIYTQKYTPSAASGVTTPLPHREGTGVGLYARFFERPFLNEAARRFLFEERRLDERVVRWCRLTSWTDRQGVPWLQIPYYNQEGKLVGVQNRNLTPSKPPRVTPSKPPRGEALSHSPSGETEGGLPRFRFPKGSECGIYNLPVLNRLKPGDELYIAEGCSDCWSLLSAGHKAIAIPSATLLTRHDIEILSTLRSSTCQPVNSSTCQPVNSSTCQLVNSSTEFHMYPDNDVPGERLFLQLQQVLPGLVRHQLPPGCKDYSDLYLRLRQT